jgi:tetratricopeptide (TPR) repeat protein
VADKDEKKAPDKGEKFDPQPVKIGGESIVDRLMPHRKKILFIILLGFLTYGVIAIFVYFRDTRLEKNTKKLATVIEVGDRQVRAPNQPADPTATEPTYADLKERANAILDAMGRENTDAAGPAYKASMLVTAGKLDEAIAAYREAQLRPGLEGVIAREGLGLALEMKANQEKDQAAKNKGLEDALTAFKAMQPDEKGVGRGYALYHQGRILMQLGKKDDAKTTLQQAKTAGKDPDLVERVDERLAMLGA